ncbi:MAG: TolC family protein [Proteobacteria bacterium]|nr:TolC family protein [Pseudomonadota bacterium]MBU4447914.1 TolC family protein [Pseudomonadota bacterium]MCG2770971.1 TolC family protein [Desulfobacterales bacterium]
MVKCSQCRYVLAVGVLWLGLGLGHGAGSQAWAQTTNVGLPPDLQALIAESLKANPEIKQKSQLKAAAQETIKPAGSLDNPQAGFALLNLPTDTWSFAQEPMTQKAFSLSQKIPFPGKRRLRSEVAEEQARSDDLAYKDKMNEVRALVIQRYWSLALTYSGYDITERNKQFWEQVVQVAETRYSVGQARQPDVLQAQVELGNYLNRLLQWRQRQESFVADLNALRSQPPQTPMPKPQALKARPLNLKLADLLAQAKSRPQLEAFKALITRQDKAVELARKDYYPDFNVGVAYGLREKLDPPVNRNQADFFTTTFMLDIPIWRGSKIEPKIREQLERKGAAQEAYNAFWDRLGAAVKDRFVKLQRLDQQITLYDRGIIPQARQAASASLADYSVGQLDFARMYQNQIAAFNADLALQEFLKDFEENWAELEWLVGAELPRSAGGSK